LLAALTGFLLVRYLPKEQYAWFTLTNTLLATISSLSDSGLGSATHSLGGPILGEPAKFASLVRTTYRLRHVFAWTSAVVVLPIGAWALHRNGASPTEIGTLLALVMLAVIPSVENVVLQAVVRLHSRLRFMLQADLIYNTSRLALTLIALTAGVTASLASAATVGAQWTQRFVLRRQTKTLIDLHTLSEQDHHWRPQVLNVVRSYFPLCMFGCVQGSLTTWLLGFLGTAANVADIGALGRLSVVFTFLTLPMSHLIGPAISRAVGRRRTMRLCVTTLGFYTGSSLIIVVVAFLMSHQILWLLGTQYAHLTTELLWYLGASMIALLSNVGWSIVLAKGWVRHSWIHIPITLALQAAATQFLDLSQLTQAVTFSAIGSLVSAAVAFSLIARSIRKMDTSILDSSVPASDPHSD